MVDNSRCLDVRSILGGRESRRIGSVLLWLEGRAIIQRLARRGVKGSSEGEASELSGRQEESSSEDEKENSWLPGKSAGFNEPRGICRKPGEQEVKKGVWT